jgi:hypothetical protein
MELSQEPNHPRPVQLWKIKSPREKDGDGSGMDSLPPASLCPHPPVPMCHKAQVLRDPPWGHLQEEPRTAVQPPSVGRLFCSSRSLFVVVVGVVLFLFCTGNCTQGLFLAKPYS